MKNMVLNVMISCRDRINLTQKTIESVHKYSTIFQKIRIFCFDNLSCLDSERLSIFQKLLKEGLIQYYSFDTSESLYNCFGKTISFQRWIQMMKDEIIILNQHQKNIREKEKTFSEYYYLLLDNDMILCDKWDQYFVSAADCCKDCAYFLVKWPGGCLDKNRPFEKNKILNKFNPSETFEVINDHVGGSSALWFMTKRMLLTY